MLFLNTIEGVGRWGEKCTVALGKVERANSCLEFDWLKCLPTPTSSPSLQVRWGAQLADSL